MLSDARKAIRRGTAPGILLVLLTAVISGVATFVNTLALRANPAWNSDPFVTVRNVAVALMLVPLAALAWRAAPARLTRRDWGKLVTIGLVGGAIPFLLFFRGIQVATGQGGAAAATFGYRTLFVMATVLGVVVLRERFHIRLALAAGLLLAGSALLLTLTGAVWTDGTAYVLAATAMWAGEYALSKHALRTLAPGTVALGRMGFGGAFLLAYIGLTGQAGSIPAMGAAWPWILLSSVLLVGFVTTWYAGLKHVDLSVASAALVLAFPITWVLTVASTPAAWGLPQAAGAVTIAFGVALAVGMASLRQTWDYLACIVRLRLRRAAVR